jgi:hypothetical protein
MRAEGEWFDIAPADAVSAVKAAAAMCIAMEGAVGTLPLFDFVQPHQASAKRGWKLVGPRFGRLRSGLERMLNGQRRDGCELTGRRIKK